MGGCGLALEQAMLVPGTFQMISLARLGVQGRVGIEQAGVGVQGRVGIEQPGVGVQGAGGQRVWSDATHLRSPV